MVAPIDIEIAVGGPLAAALGDAGGLAEAISADVSAVLAAVGLPGEPQVTLTVADGRRPVQITVHGHRQRFGPEVLRRAWSHAAPDEPAPRQPDEVDGFPAGWLDELDEQRPQIVARAAAALLRATIGEVLRDRPGALVGRAQAGAYGNGQVDAEVLELVLTRLLDHGVAISDRPLLLDTLTIGLEAGRSADDVVEGVLRRLRSDVLELHVHPESARDLLGVEVEGPLSALDPRLAETVRGPFLDTQKHIERRGIPCPDVVWVAGAEAVMPRHVRVKVNDALGPARRIPGPDEAVVDESLERLARHGIEDGQQLSLYGRPMTLVGTTSREALERVGGIRAWDGPQTVALLVAEEATLRGDRLLTVAEAEHQLAQLSRYYPKLVEDATNAFSPSQLTRMFRALLSEMAPIDDLRAILWRLVLFDPSPLVVPADWMVLDDLLPGPDVPLDAAALEARQVAFARLGLGEVILQDLKPPGRPLVVLPVFDAKQRIADDAGADELLDEIWAVASDPRLRGAALAVVTELEARAQLGAFLRAELPYVPVLAVEEVPWTETVVNVSEAEGPMIALEELARSRVGEILMFEFGAVTDEADGGYWVLMDGTMLHAAILRAGKYVIVRISGIAITSVPRSAELYRWVAEGPQDAAFGHVRMVAGDDEDHVDLLAIHELLGNYLDHDELVVGVVGVASVAQAAAEQVMERFGGKPLAQEVTPDSGS